MICSHANNGTETGLLGVQFIRMQTMQLAIYVFISNGQTNPFKGTPMKCLPFIIAIVPFVKSLPTVRSTPCVKQTTKGLSSCSSLSFSMHPKVDSTYSFYSLLSISNLFQQFLCFERHLSFLFTIRST